MTNIEKGIAAAIVVLLVATLTAAYFEAKAWERYRVAHDCRKERTRTELQQVWQVTDYETGQGEFRPQLVTITTWVCWENGQREEIDR